MLLVEHTHLLVSGTETSPYLRNLKFIPRICCFAFRFHCKYEAQDRSAFHQLLMTTITTTVGLDDVAGYTQTWMRLLLKM